MNGKIKQAAAALIDSVNAECADESDKISALNQVGKMLNANHPLKNQPVNNVIWVDIDKVAANDYNPNSVAGREMRLLRTSIEKDGYTQPVVTIWDEKLEKYVIVDGFHRYFVLKKTDIQKQTKGMLPIVVLEKDMNERMAATVRHNRARGRHSVDGMSNLIFKMLQNGATDSQIEEELGLEADEINRLKHITGFAKLFENKEYGRAWKNKKQIELEKQAKNK